jgi:tetratricopeptide (TPR) repeat protein
MPAIAPQHTTQPQRSAVQPMALEAGCQAARGLLQQGQPGQAWALLQALDQSHPQKPVVRRLQGAVLSANGQHRQALAHFRTALALAPHDHLALAAAAGCLHMLGKLPLAVQYHRAALVWQCSAPLRLATPPAAATFDSAAAEQRLWQVLAQLAAAGLHAFATSGTLLGLVRGGALLPFDKDLDIGLPFAEVPAATALLLASGWARTSAPHGMVNPVMLQDGQGLSLDLCGFVAEEGSGAALGGFWLQGAPADWQRITQYPTLHFQQQQSPQGSVWSVRNPQVWLAALYGPDWRTPDPDFDTVIAAHNLRGFAVQTQCYAYGRIYGRWLGGQLQKAAALVSQTLRHNPADPLLLQVQQCLARQQASAAAAAVDEAL